MESESRAIGVFDSGIGGLTVLKEIIDLLPGEDTLYYADAANCPYGTKSKEEIIGYSSKAVDFLLSKGVKIIVVACNTATSTSIKYLREHYDIPFVAIEPAVKPAVLSSKSGVVGILATDRTVHGEAFMELCEKWSAKASISATAACGLAEAVEKHQENEPQTEFLVRRYIEPMIEQGADCIVLGCTHYPFLMPVISKIIAQRDIKVLNPAPAIAKRTKELLIDLSLLNPRKDGGKHLFFSNSTKEYTEELPEKLKTLY